MKMVIPKVRKTMEASEARGSIGRASYEAVRAHIDNGKRATEAFKLVAEQTGRSPATVQTAYYRIARSLPDGGGVRLRPRKKSASKPTRKRAAGPKTAAAPAARRKRSPGTGQSSSTAKLAQQLSAAAEALAAHLDRLEAELAKARTDSQRLAEIERTLSR